MNTLAQMRDSIRVYVGDEFKARFSDTQLTSFINQALQTMGETLRNYTKSSTVVVPATGFVAVPSDFIAIVALRNIGNPLWKIDARDVLRYRAASIGTPTYFYLRGRNLYVYPLPPANITLDIDYIAQVPTLSADGDLPDASLGSEIDQYVQYRVAADLLIAGQDYEGAAAYTTKAQQYEARIRGNQHMNDYYEAPRVGGEDEGTDSVGMSWLF